MWRKGRRDISNATYAYTRNLKGHCTCYDFCCAEHEYGLNREGMASVMTIPVIPRFHADNHKSCSPTLPKHDKPALKALNGEAAEQRNRPLALLRPWTENMRLGTFMRFMMVCTREWYDMNTKNAERVARWPRNVSGSSSN